MHVSLRNRRVLIRLGIVFLSATLMISFYLLSAPVPRYRVERLFFGTLLPLYQQMIGLAPPELNSKPQMVFESETALRELKNHYALDRLISSEKDDFRSAVALMHWVRDQFPHAIPKIVPPSQSFNGLKVLTDFEKSDRDGGFLCGTAAQLLIQAIQATGGFARRVELRFTPKDAHAVVEVWSEAYQKWVVLDPDYDLYYTVDGVPQNALELHDYFSRDFDLIDRVEVNVRESSYGIYQVIPDALSQDDFRRLKRIIAEEGDAYWDDRLATIDPVYKQRARFSVKLLNYYRGVSYPLRTDWVSRPLSWWHPEANHVQNSVVIKRPKMRLDEDFPRVIEDASFLYQPPSR